MNCLGGKKKPQKQKKDKEKVKKEKGPEELASYQIEPLPPEERKELTGEEEKVTLDVKEKGKIRRFRFASEDEKQHWQKYMKKRRLYIPYFLVGIGINLLLYRAGLDLSRDLLWGPIAGLGIPMATMLALTELHYRLFRQPKPNDG